MVVERRHRRLLDRERFGILLLGWHLDLPYGLRRIGGRNQSERLCLDGRSLGLRGGNLNKRGIVETTRRCDLEHPTRDPPHGGRALVLERDPKIVENEEFDIRQGIKSIEAAV